MTKHIIIIGSGLAGYNVARGIRQHDKEVRVTIITHDGGAFYSKPQLSTALAHNKTADALMAMSAEKMAVSQDITILTHHEVIKISPESNTIHLAEESLQYDALVLAVGAHTPMPYLEGDGVHDVLHVNDVYQYAEFRKAIEEKKHVTIMGAGLVGCEFANDLVLNGFKVDVVDPAAAPLTGLLPEAVGSHLANALADAGVNWHFGHVATRVDKKQSGYVVTLSNNEVIETDVVLSAIGLRPNVKLADEAGVTIRRGIVVDQYCRSSVHNIYALGDCAEVSGFVLPYVMPIMQCAKALALTLTGMETSLQYPAMPVVVKTTAYPICVCPPPPGVQGCWDIQEKDDGVRAYFNDKNGVLQGFVLTKEAIKERMMLAQKVEAWIA